MQACRGLNLESLISRMTQIARIKKKKGKGSVVGAILYGCPRLLFF